MKRVLTNDLVGEELGIVLAVQVRLRRLGGVELETLANTFTQDVTSRVSFHNLSHCLLDERLHAREPVTVRRP